MGNDYLNEIICKGLLTFICTTGYFETIELNDNNKNQIVGYNKYGWIVENDNGHTHTENNNTSTVSEVAKALTTLSGYNENFSNNYLER